MHGIIANGMQMGLGQARLHQKLGRSSNWEKCPLACGHSPRDADGRGQRQGGGFCAEVGSQCASNEDRRQVGGLLSPSDMAACGLSESVPTLGRGASSAPLEVVGFPCGGAFGKGGSYRAGLKAALQIPDVNLSLAFLTRLPWDRDELPKLDLSLLSCTLGKTHSTRPSLRTV